MIIDWTNFINLKDTDETNYITLDIPFFESFGINYFYINYSINRQKFINVYSKNDIIKEDDFILNETKLKIQFKNLLCSSVKYYSSSKQKNEYITNYLKLFYNNKNELTPELILYNYDQLNIDLTDIKLVTIIDKRVKEYSSNSIILE